MVLLPLRRFKSFSTCNLKVGHFQQDHFQKMVCEHMKTNMNMEDGTQGHLFAEQDFLDKGKPVLNQPPLSQSDSAFLEPESPEEVSWV
ncbi:hypothetical protein SO802_013970 [Lithocarpus litseifolius]|uniref:Uncharacterized protein n=1 Tax=Lithocarpus litseifolius TaxID=425828 RepID=A0AAW2D8I0_9ROSI